MNRYGSTNADRYPFGILGRKGKHLAKAANIQPVFASLLGIGVSILNAFHNSGSPLTEASITVCTTILRLNKNSFSQVLHPIANLAFDAHVRYFTKAV